MAGVGRPGPECSIARVLKELPDDTADLLTEKMDETWGGTWVHGHTELADWLNAADDIDAPFRISQQMVGWHRRGRCRCAQS